MKTKALISIETQSFRKFFKAVCEEYKTEITTMIDGKEFYANDHDWLIANWCNRSNLSKTINFVIKKDDNEIFGFHDSPYNLWADVSQLDFLEKLRGQKIIKYDIYTNPEPSNILQKFLWFFKSRKPIKRTRG